MTLTSILDNSKKAQAPSAQHLPDWHLPAICIFLDLIAWVFTSVVEENLSIIALHLMFLVTSGGLLYLMRNRTATRIFSVALILRSLFTIAAWYLAYTTRRQVNLGTYADTEHYWAVSFWPYSDAAASFSDPLFPKLNTFLTTLSIAIDGPAYLGTMQSLLFAGTMFAMLSYTFARDLYGEKVGRLTGYLMAFSPIAITFSTGLLRDALIGMFGFLLLNAFNWIIISPRWSGKLGFGLIGIGAAAALAYLRTVSLVAFVMAGFLIVMFTTPIRAHALSLRARIWIVVLLVLLAAIGVSMRPERVLGVMDFSQAASLGVTGGLVGFDTLQNGITIQILKISPFLFIAIAPVALMQPLPFYSWQPPYWMPGPPAFMDVVQGFGALYNQLIFGFYILAVFYWFLTRDKLGIFLGVVYTLLICAAVLAGLGQIRMTMAHTYPLFYMGIAIAMQTILHGDKIAILKVSMIWISSMASLYGAYLCVKNPELMAFCLLFSLFAFWGIWSLWKTAQQSTQNVGA